jgi:hypothetical protein
VLESLFTNNLESRGYFMNSSAEAQFTCWFVAVVPISIYNLIASIVVG